MPLARSIYPLFLLVPALSLGCPKTNETGKAGATATPSSTAPRTGDVPNGTPPTNDSSAGAAGPTDCPALREKVAALATTARKCDSGANACKRCVPGYLHHCGIFVGDENSSATREYLDARKELLAKACMLPTTATPQCSPDPAGKCGADGSCAPGWCKVSEP